MCPRKLTGENPQTAEAGYLYKTDTQQTLKALRWTTGKSSIVTYTIIKYSNWLLEEQ